MIYVSNLMGRPVADADGVVIMKMLASITIVISLPTMVSSFYGMNVSLPLDEHPVTFLAILAAAFALSLGAAFVFWKKDWL